MIVGLVIIKVNAQKQQSNLSNGKQMVDHHHQATPLVCLSWF